MPIFFATRLAAARLSPESMTVRICMSFNEVIAYFELSLSSSPKVMMAIGDEGASPFIKTETVWPASKHVFAFSRIAQ